VRGTIQAREAIRSPRQPVQVDMVVAPDPQLRLIDVILKE